MTTFKKKIVKVGGTTCTVAQKWKDYCNSKWILCDSCYTVCLKRLKSMFLEDFSSPLSQIFLILFFFIHESNCEFYHIFHILEHWSVWHHPPLFVKILAVRRRKQLFSIHLPPRYNITLKIAPKELVIGSLHTHTHTWVLKGIGGMLDSEYYSRPDIQWCRP